MNKGYIIPAILIVLLLVLAGFFVNTPVQSPVIRDTSPPKVATTTPVIEEDLLEDIVDIATTSEIDRGTKGELEEISTSTDAL